MNELLNVPKHSDLIYDIGLHKGEDSEFYLKKGFRVVAFEANPDLVAFCKNRLKEFIASGQLVIIEGAIVDFESGSPQKVSFHKFDDMSVWGTVCTDWSERNTLLGAKGHIIEVNTINLSDVIKVHGIPHYMKIDIEGCDMVCVNVLKKFRERPGHISLESDKTSMEEIRREIEALSFLGYTDFKAVEQSNIQHSQTPPRPPREGKYVNQQFEEGCSGLFGAELDGEWKSRSQILREYCLIMLGYHLDSILSRQPFKGSRRLRSWVYRLWWNNSILPGWYDTHARHSSLCNEKN